ncbi:MAG: 30S ribosomal protein S16 [Planctomycetales bacterium]|nr:30S ribosomal protein S16 [Planctomycetales bacterium]
MAVKIRLKRMGRTHRPFYRVCAMDTRSPRDGRVIEELGYYDPMVKETDARAILKSERIDYWLGVGAQPSDKMKVLIKKYGTNGTHLDEQKAALDRLNIRPEAPPPTKIELPKKEEPAAETPADEAASAEASAEGEGGSEGESSES